MAGDQVVEPSRDLFDTRQAIQPGDPANLRQLASHFMHRIGGDEHPAVRFDHTNARIEIMFL